MTLRNTKPIRFSPKGLSDTLDATDLFPGACANLQNLIPDLSTVDLWTCRPSSIAQTSFGTFTTPGAISVLKVVGTWVYGLIASGRFAGNDEPFAFNLLTQTFATVANVTSSNVPVTQSLTGDWVPATMDLVGINLVVTHPGFNGSGNGYFGWFDITTQSAPRWHSGNLQQNGSIQALGAITGGSLYTAGTYLNVPLTGGSGSGATADITVAGGAVTSVVLDTWGAGYVASTDNLSAAAANIGGTGSGFLVNVAQVATTVSGRIQMTTPPAWVRQFYQRAYFGINPTNAQPSAIFTDVLFLGCSAAGMALTFGDNVALTAAAPLGLSNQLGGIIQALMVFKDDSNIVQITGDFTGSTISLNTLNVAVGTIAPRSIVSTPQGILFLSGDGFRLLDFDARISDPISAGGKGITLPFINATSPTRISASCNGTVMRASLLSNLGLWQEYWYDLVRKAWSGPHTFPSVVSDVYGYQFVLAPQALPATLYLGPVIPRTTDTFVERGVAMTWEMQTSVLADEGEMAEAEVTELQVKTTLLSSGMNVSAIDQDGNTLSSQSYQFVGSGTPWGSAGWGTFAWSALATGLAARRIDFPSPVVYNRLALSLQGQCAANFKIGDIYLRHRQLGYLQVSP